MLARTKGSSVMTFVNQIQIQICDLNYIEEFIQL